MCDVRNSRNTRYINVPKYKPVALLNSLCLLLLPSKSLKYMNNELAIKEWAIKSSAISQNLLNLFLSLFLSYSSVLAASSSFFLLVVCFLFFIQCSFALDKRSPYKRSWTTNCLSIPHQKPIQKTRNWSQNFLFYYSNLKRFSFYFFFIIAKHNKEIKNNNICFYVIHCCYVCVCVSVYERNLKNYFMFFMAN